MKSRLDQSRHRWGRGLLLITLALFGVQASAELIIHWPLDGDATDIISGDWNGRLIGPVPAPDRNGNPRGALLFDGKDDRIETPWPLPTGSGPMTVSVWIKPDKDTDRGIIIGNYSHQPNFNFEVHGNNLRTWWNDGKPDVRGGNNMRDGQWHLVAMVREGEGSNAKLRLYIDGDEVKSAGSGADLTLRVPHVIGVDTRIDSDVQFEGLMDDMRIYDHALSPTEIRSLATDWRRSPSSAKSGPDSSALEAELRAIVRGEAAPAERSDNGKQPAPRSTANDASSTSLAGLTYTPGKFETNGNNPKRDLRGRMGTDSDTGCQAWTLYDHDNASVRWFGDCIGGYASGFGVLVMFSEADRAQVFNPKCVVCEGEAWVGTVNEGMPDGQFEMIVGGYHGVEMFFPDEMKRQRIRRTGFHPDDEKRVKAFVRSVFQQAE